MARIFSAIGTVALVLLAFASPSSSPPPDSSGGKVCVNAIFVLDPGVRKWTPNAEGAVKGLDKTFKEELAKRPGVAVSGCVMDLQAEFIFVDATPEGQDYPRRYAYVYRLQSFQEQKILRATAPSLPKEAALAANVIQHSSLTADRGTMFGTTDSDRIRELVRSFASTFDAEKLIRNW